MPKTLFKRQIPTIVGLIVLFIGAGAGVILVGNGTDFLPRAGPEYTPKSLQITNVTNQSFTVSWVTDAAAVGFVRYGDSTNVTTTSTDDRDQLSGDTGSFRVHHVTVRGLDESTTYFFKVGSGPSQSLFDDQGKPYQVTTGPTLDDPQESESLYGKVFTSAQTPAEGSIVYVQVGAAAPLSTLVNGSGSWAVSLATLREQSLKKYYAATPGQQVSLEILSPDGQTTTGTTSIYSESKPVPTINLGTTFDYSESVEKESVQPAKSAPSSAVELLNPSYDGEQVNSSKPEIQGSAPPNTVLEITVHSTQAFEGEVLSDENGEFSWSPPDNLEPGDHTITISWLDSNGIRQFFERHFVVLAQGDSTIPALTATPSATPKASATPTPTATPKPSPTATPTPTATPKPSPTITPTPSARASQPSSASSVPVAGSTGTTWIMLALGGLFIASGAVLSTRIN